MRYVPEAVGSSFLPKLVGSYEAELHGVIEELIGRDYRTIIDIGSAEGYYVVGLARRCPAARIYAFDMDRLGRLRCANMAHLSRAWSEP